MTKDEALKAIDEATLDALKQEFDMLRVNVGAKREMFEKMSGGNSPEQAFATGVKNLMAARDSAMTIVKETLG